MQQLRHRFLRDTGLAAFLLFGLLSLAHAAFVCELRNAGRQLTCCCTEQPSAGCEQGGGCETHLGAQPSDCCEVSRQDVPTLNVAPVQALSLAVFIGDNPNQPGPLPSAAGAAWANPPQTQSGTTIFPWWSATRTYLLTSRFRS